MKAIAAVVALGAGERINVSGVCREAGISRKTFYKWHARYLAEGLDGRELKDGCTHFEVLRLTSRRMVSALRPLSRAAGPA